MPKSKLAIRGGKKTVNIPPPHFKWPIITKESIAAVVGQIRTSTSIYDRSGIIKEFEEKFAKYHKRKYALLTDTGTNALYSIFVGGGLKKEDEVLCPVYTFFATVTPLFFTGAVPVLCESLEDGNIDPEDIRKKITPKTKAIIVTHMWGLPCDMDEIVKISRKHNLLLFEDCSHSHGATYKEKKVGTFGDAAVWSLQAQKLVTGGEGGMLLTDNKEIYYRALLLGHYNKRCKQEISPKHKYYRYAVTGMGLKLRSHPLGVALASQQFRHLDKWLKQKRAWARYITQELSGLPGLRLPEPGKAKKHSWYAYLIQYKPEELNGLSIERFFKALVAEGCLEADRPGSTCPLNLLPLFQNPVPLFPRYKGKVAYRKGDFPVAEKFHGNAIKFPVWSRPEDKRIVNLYIRAIKKVVANYKELL